ncbi:MAG TPA: hypothetical protein VGD67_06005, partial [Pseudonocardiaceae bacterium]
MSETPREFRRWLLGLDDSDLGVLLSFSHELRWAAFVPTAGARPATDLGAVRAWLSAASEAQLASLAFDAVEAAAERLITEHGADRIAVASPNREQMGRFLVALGRPVGRFVLFSLLIGDGPVSALAIRHRTELEGELATMEDLSVATPNSGGPISADSADRPPRRDIERAELATIEAQLTELRELAAELATRLTRAAEAVTAGRPAERVSPAAYETLRGRLVSALGELYPLTPSSGFADLDGALMALRERLPGTGPEPDRAAKLRQQIATLSALVAHAVDEQQRAEFRRLLTEARSLLAAAEAPVAGFGADPWADQGFPAASPGAEGAGEQVVTDGPTPFPGEPASTSRDRGPEPAWSAAGHDPAPVAGTDGAGLAGAGLGDTDLGGADLGGAG